jgi:hypothetical protein
MAVISLPTNPSPNGMTPLLRDFGGVLTPFLGGPEQMLVRIGTRFGVRVSLPPMRTDVLGRIYISRLLQGRQNFALLKWPLLEFNPGTPGTPLIATAATSGSSLALKGLTAGYVIKEGQFFSIIVSGQRYLYMANADVTASGGGTATVSMFPLLRKAVSVNDVVEIAQPMIEGLVSPGDELSWEIASNRFMGIGFTIMERA